MAPHIVFGSTVPIFVLAFGCFGYTASQVWTVKSTSSYYELVMVTDIDPTIVSISYKRTESFAKCSTKCSGINARSLYFNEAKSICYCNDQLLDPVVPTTAESNVTYSYLSHGYVTETSSEYERRVFMTANYSGCHEISAAGYSQDGVYTVYPSQSIAEDHECDLKNGGWRLFQRRMDGSVDFYRSWTDYVNGFGDLDGEFWLGLEEIHQISKDGCELLISIEAEENVIKDHGFAHYSNFSVSDANTNYTLHVSGFTGDIYDALEYHSGIPFSTFDIDNDFADGSCAQYFKSGWWHGDCLFSSLNGEYFEGENACSGIIWHPTWVCGEDMITRTEMKVRC